jgi:hypothetical protein
VTRCLSIKRQVTTMASPTPILDDYLTDDELAAELRVDARTIKRRRARSETPPMVRIGNRPYTRRSGIVEWLRSREQGAGQ